MPQLVIGKRYYVTDRLGSGNFGHVFLCMTKYTGKLVAAKVSSDAEMLKRESQFYRLLRDIEHVPRLLWYGAEGKYTFMVMPVLR